MEIPVSARARRSLLPCNQTWGGRALLHIHQLNIEDQCGVRRDHAGIPFLPVSQIGRNAKLTFAAHFHSGDAFIPAFDHVARPDAKRERRAAHRAVELFSGREPTGVVNLDLLAVVRLGARAHLDVPILQAGRGFRSIARHLCRPSGCGLLGGSLREGNGASDRTDQDYDDGCLHHSAPFFKSTQVAPRVFLTLARSHRSPPARPWAAARLPPSLAPAAPYENAWRRPRSSPRSHPCSSRTLWCARLCPGWFRPHSEFPPDFSKPGQSETPR